ncbi:uncharacterized protein LOC126823364 [Patella vulgata]|uniref:uncharacterized protein LOC126823364 n=1 Tax=Patella vulgata TaxID=6465 RepID=UPI0021800561|nr:uncharacterized protein LOC126823364 [Patella vulgata]
MAEERITQWQKIKRKLNVVKPGTTPPNWKCIGLMFVALLSSAFSLSFLFPFLPEMVLTFGYSEEEKGYYVGLIASSVFAGRIIGSYIWGYLSDVRGRRIVLLVCIFCNGSCCLAFGFSTNLALAIVFRFLAGLLNGIVGTAKAVLYEISDDTNQAIGMSTISLAWGSGLILGPTLGGWLASPAKKYPNLFDPDGFLGMFPYVLPGISCFTVSLFSFAWIFFKFEETSTKKDIDIIIEDIDGDVEEMDLTSSENVHKSRSVENLKLNQYQAISCEDLHNECEAGTFFVKTNLMKEEILKSTEGLNKSEAKINRTTKDEIISGENVTELLLESSAKNDLKSNSDLSINKLNNRYETKDDKGQDSATDCTEDDKDRESNKKESCWSRFVNSTPVVLMRTSDIRNSILLYTVYSFGVIGFEDIFTIWASTEPRLDGLGFDTSEIGTILGAVAIPLLLIQLVIYPPIVNKLGIKMSFIVFNIVIIIAVQTLPVLHLIYDKKIVLWVFLILILLAEKLGVNCCFSGSSLLINNSCEPKLVGAVNGMAMTFTAIARTLAPTVGGSLFAWSVGYGSQHIGAPFDVNLSFIFFGLVFMLSCLMCIFLPKSLNKQKKAMAM